MWPFNKKEPEKKKDTYPKTLYDTYCVNGWVGYLEHNPLESEIVKTHKFRGVVGENWITEYYRRGDEIMVLRANITYVKPISVDALAEYEYEKD